ncbi:PACE efflux transporter [Hafnia psychrotolerans]|uniref:LysR family transcriptional regulator n=1 Tax=Hafnia psychrotolerans TaxID=1477018 RepID=A0ABQ1G1D9_9GAMM|nr:PACE efflux transporter [Hafnia psychrotolerans]GGA35538.1 LysR family transcriptional regulator [Hafnia psychrotolerans]
MQVELNKSVGERILHAVLFELIGNVLVTLVVAYLLQVSLLQSGTLSMISALMAMVWNYIFNKIFDELQKRYAFERNFLMRLLHAVAFEVGLILTLTPVVMILLNLSLINALIVEIGLVLFFLPYTIIYNWSYDYIRGLLVRRQRQSGAIE